MQTQLSIHGAGFGYNELNISRAGLLLEHIFLTEQHQCLKPPAGYIVLFMSPWPINLILHAHLTGGQ